MKTQFRTGLRPLTPSDALFEWYHRGVEEDNRLTTKARLLVGGLAAMAACEDGAPLPYTLTELAKKFGWRMFDTWQAAEVAASGGYVDKLDAEALILTDPRARKPMVPPGAEFGCSGRAFSQRLRWLCFSPVSTGDFPGNGLGHRRVPGEVSARLRRFLLGDF